MMGYNHVSCGLLAGIATLPIAPVTGPAAQTAWVIALGGASLIPDLDTSGSAAARMWGPITRTLGAAIGTLAHGHRQGTHDAVLAPASFAGISLLASLHPITTGVVLALTIGLALRGLALAGVGRIGAAANLLVSAVTAWILVSAGAHQIRLLPLVIAAGVLIHIAGDWLTNEGIPIPIAWILGHRDRLSVGLFKVNGLLERTLVAPALSLAAVVLLAAHLGIHDVDSLARWCGAQLQQLPAPFNRNA
jgi:membrane-bound metal-dependent hydrolase YbcI (DUF457 family)